MNGCELVRQAIDLDRPLDETAREHAETCVDCAREWRSHEALTAHFEATAPAPIPPVPAAIPLPAAAEPGARIPGRLGIALVRIYLVGFILASGWILRATLPELSGVLAVDRVALFAGIVGLSILALRPMRMMMRLLVEALRI